MDHDRDRVAVASVCGRSNAGERTARYGRVSGDAEAAVAVGEPDEGCSLQRDREPRRLRDTGPHRERGRDQQCRHGVRRLSVFLGTPRAPRRLYAETAVDTDIGFHGRLRGAGDLRVADRRPLTAIKAVLFDLDGTLMDTACEIDA